MKIRFELLVLNPDDWRVYKTLRLRALRDEPQAFLSTYETTSNEPDEEWRGRLEKALLQNGQWLFFAKVDEELVGMVGAFGNTDEAEIVAVYVDRKYRSKGIGMALINHIIDHLRESHVMKVKLEVNATMDPAVGLYKKCGFAVVGENKRVLGDGKEYLTLLMELPLS